MIRNYIDLLKINGVDVRTAKHEDVVKILTSCTDKVSLVAYRERVINKKMIPMSQINGSIGGQIKTVGEPTKVRFWLWKYMFSATIFLVKVNNRNTRKWYEICSKLTIKTPERCHWRRSGVFIINFEHILHVLLVFILLTIWTSKC